MKIKKEVKLGAFFLVTIALFIFGVLVFGKIRLNSGAYSFYIDFNYSGDLRENGKVRYRGGGIDIGFIEKMTINEYGDITVKVTMTDTNIKLPLDTVFSVSTVGMGIGEKYILADPPIDPNPDIDYIRDGDILIGVSPVSIEATLGSLGDMGKDFDINSIVSLISEVKNTVELLNEILAMNEDPITSSVSNIEGISADVKRFSSTLSRYERKIDRILDNADATMLYTKNVMEVIDRDKHRIPAIIQNLEVFSQRVRHDPSALLFSKPSND